MFPAPPGRHLWVKRALRAGSSARESTGTLPACGEAVRGLVTSRAGRRRRLRRRRCRSDASSGACSACRLRSAASGVSSASASASSSATTASISASACSCSASASACCGGLGLRFRCGDRVELLLGRQLAALGHDREPQRRRDVREELDRDLVAADPLDRVGEVDLAAVDPDLLALPDASATSVAVTEPKSVPVSPAGTSKRSSLASSRCAISCACSKLCASCRARFCSTLAQLGHLGRASPALRACAAAGSCARTRARRRRPRRGGRPSRRPVGG